MDEEKKEKYKPGLAAKVLGVFLYINFALFILLAFFLGRRVFKLTHRAVWLFCFEIGKLVEQGHLWGWERNRIVTVAIEVAIVIALFILPLFIR